MTTDVKQLVKELVEKGQWEEAQSILLRLVHEEPNNSQLQFTLGTVFFNQGNFNFSEEHLKSALAMDGNYAECYYYLGLIDLRLNRQAEAVHQFRTACELKEDYALAHLHWGLALHQMGSLRGAIGQYNQAVKLNSKLMAANYQAGVACYDLGEYLEAAQYFKSAALIDPKMAEAFNGLGLCYLALGQVEDSLNCFREAWKLDDRLLMVQRNWAVALSQLGQYDEAREHYQTALGTGAKVLAAQDRGLVYNDWGVNLFCQGRYDEAAEKLIQSIDIDPDLVSARLNLGMVHSVLSEYEMAAQAFERALELSPELPQINMFCGIAYFFLGNYADAESKFLSALNGGKEHGWSHPELNIWLAYTEIALGNYRQAVLYFEAALADNPNNYLVLDGLGQCLLLAGQTDKAGEIFTRVLTVNNEYALGHWHLAVLLEQVGRLEEAEPHYQRAVNIDPSCLDPHKEALEKALRKKQIGLVLDRGGKLLRLAPGDVELNLYYAQALKSANRLDECEQIVRRLLAMHPQLGPAHSLLAQLAMNSGQLADADDHFLKASVLYEGDVPLFYNWGRCLCLLGMNELALEKFVRAAEIDPYEGDTYEAWAEALKTLGRFADVAAVYKQAQEYL